MYITGVFDANVELVRFGLLHGWQPPADILHEHRFPATLGPAFVPCVEVLLRFARGSIEGPNEANVKLMVRWVGAKPKNSAGEKAALVKMLTELGYSDL